MLDLVTVKDYVRRSEPGTVLRPTEVAEKLGGDPTVGLMASYQEGLVVPVYAHVAERLEWVDKLQDLGVASSVDPSKVLVGFRRC